MNQNNDRLKKAAQIVIFGDVYAKYLNEPASNTVKKLSDDLNRAYVMGSPEAEETITSITKKREEYQEKKQKIELNYTRTLKNENMTKAVAGFINASILLYFILIFGVLIALSLIIFQF